MDLIALQQNSGKIRNPFGFDFSVTWNKKPIILKGDGKWKQVIGPLREHIAKHLYMKIRYQYHDEQVAKLKDMNREKEARKFRVPAAVENKIWFMITGEPLPGKPGRDQNMETEKADLTELKNQLSELDKNARSTGGPVNVSALIEKANVEALGGGDITEGDTAHASGTGDLNGKDIPQTPTDTKPVDAEDVQLPKNDTVLPADAPADPSEGSEFGDLAELDNE